MRSSLRISALRERLRGSLWSLPSASVLLAVVSGTVLAEVRPEPGSLLESMVFGGSAEGARSLLEVIAGAMMTVTALTFSLTVVALQMSAGQYSPRVLRNFLSDRGNKLVLSTFLGTFAYCLAVLRIIRDGDGGEETIVPSVAVTVGVVLSLVAVGTLVYFIHHLSQQLRVESIVREIVVDTLATIDRVHPAGVDERPASTHEPLPADDAVRVRARRSGFVQAVELEGLVGRAEAGDLVVRIRPAVGAHIAGGTTLGWVWAREGGPIDAEEDKELLRLVHDHVHIGPERTMQQDVVFGLRQLVDIVAKALSTGMNDPTTAVDAIGNLSIVVCRLALRRLGAHMVSDEDGRVRVLLPRPDLADYLHMAVDQPRRYGADEPAIVLALLRMLADVAEQVTDADYAAAVETEVARTMELASRALDETETARVQSAAELVQRTLEGGRRPSFTDLDS